MAAKETVEAITIRTHYANLIQIIQDPLSLAAELYSANLIARNVLNSTLESPLTKVEKTMHLLQAVSDQIAINPNNFHYFLALLEKDPLLQVLSELMFSTYCRLNQGNSSSIEQEKDEDMPYLKHSTQERLIMGYPGIPGVEVVGEEELLVTNKTISFHWKDYGFKLHVPENALPEGTPEYVFNIKASLSGQFELPKGYELVSAVYWVTTPGKFTKPVTIEVQHCANFIEASQLHFVRTSCSQKSLPYKFEMIDGGSFSLGSKYGVLSTTHFSGTGIAKEVTPGEHSCQYCAQVYFTVKHLQDHWYYCHFVVTKDLEMCFAMVTRKYQQEYDIAPPITFGTDHVALDIPDDGVQTDNGWEIVPVQKAHIEKDRVNNFASANTWIPECVLLLKWLQKGQTPSPLVHKVKLVGTGRENDFFRIVHHPGSQFHPLVSDPTTREGTSLSTVHQKNHPGPPHKSLGSQPSSPLASIYKTECPAPLVTEHQNTQPTAEESLTEGPQIELTMPTSLRPTGHQSLQKTSKSEKDESEASGATIKKQRDKKRRRCGECIGCQPIQKEDCGECAACKDKPKFGGPGKKHQPCIYHQCQKLKYKPKDSSKVSSSAAKGRCESCIGCLRNKKKDDCGQCEACKRKTKFGGDGKSYRLCRYRNCQKVKYTPQKYAPNKKCSLKALKRTNSVDAELPGKSAGEKRMLDSDNIVQKPEVSGGSAVKKMRLASDEPDISIAGNDAPPEQMKLSVEVGNEELRKQLEQSKPASNIESQPHPMASTSQAAREGVSLVRQQKKQPDAEESPLGGPQVELAIDDHFDVTNYLLDLGTTHIYNLGLTLGLNQPHVKSMRDSDTFRDDVIAAWLQREDQVTRRGVPTWRTLVRALRDRRVNQTGVADTIAAERGVTE